MFDFLLQILVWTLNAMIAGYIAIWFYKRRQRNNEEKWLKELIVYYPDHPGLYFYSIRATSEEALKELQQQVRQNLDDRMRISHDDIPPPPPASPVAPDPLT